MRKIKRAEVIIVTGLSGAGKSIAIKSIEDFGGFCVDNMPAALIGQFIKLIKTSDYSKSIIALGIDVRSRGFTENIFEILQQTEKMGFTNGIIFLEASNSTIIRRYSESRRQHPLSREDKSLKDSIEKERKSFAPLREKADVIIDTSGISPYMLKRKLKDMLFEKGVKSININITTFGYKYGIPEDVDILIDTRFLPNPHYQDQLSRKNGKNAEVINFIMKNKLSRDFVARYIGLLDFLVPNYVKEGKSYLNIGIGCTGGKHRSVVVANEICKHLKKNKYSVFTTHRDMKERASRLYMHVRAGKSEASASD